MWGFVVGVIGKSNYVMLSRCRSLSKLLLIKPQPLSADDINCYVSPAIVTYHMQMLERVSRSDGLTCNQLVAQHASRLMGVRVPYQPVAMPPTPVERKK